MTARYEQLEPVTLNMLSATAVASLYRNAKTIHRIVLAATDNSRVPLLQYGVAGERTVQRCRQKQKDRTSCDLFVCLCVTKVKLSKTFLIVYNYAVMYTSSQIYPNLYWVLARLFDLYKINNLYYVCTKKQTPENILF